MERVGFGLLMDGSDVGHGWPSEIISILNSGAAEPCIVYRPYTLPLLIVVPSMNEGTRHESEHERPTAGFAPDKLC